MHIKKIIKTEGTRGKAHMTRSNFEKKWGNDIISAMIAQAGAAAEEEYEGTGDPPMAEDPDQSYEDAVASFYTSYFKYQDVEDVCAWLAKNSDIKLEDPEKTVQEFQNDWKTLTKESQYKLLSNYETWVMRRLNDAMIWPEEDYDE